MNYPALFSFNETGLNAFERIFTNQAPDTVIDPMDKGLVSLVPGTRNFSVIEFSSAKEMAQAVLDAMGTAEALQLLSNTGLWAWLTFVMRDQLFKKSPDGSWKVGEVHRWYPSNPNDWQKGQRHLVRMPVLLLRSLGGAADHLLCGEPWKLPEIREQLTSQQDMFNPVFQTVARTLYFDEATGRLKRGAGGKTAGTPRRLARVRQQLDVTWDLEDLEPEKIIDLLPKEFDRFKPRITIARNTKTAKLPLASAPSR